MTTVFFKAVGTLLIVSILCLSVGKKEMSQLLTLAACTMGMLAALTFFSPVLSFLRELEEAADLQQNLLQVLLKAVGIGLTAQIAGSVCADAGNTSLEKTLRFLGSTAIVCISVPVFQALLSLLRQLLGEL